jgi:sugar lactone lactonase YvrE
MTVFAGQIGSQSHLDGTGTNARFTNVRGMVIYGSTLYVCDGNRIRAVNLTNAVVTTYAGSGTASQSTGTGTNASFNSVGHIAVDSNGNLFVSETIAGGYVRRITTSAVVENFSGSTMPFPNGVAVDSSGNVYVVLSNSGAIRKYTASSTFTVLAGDGTNTGSSDGVGTTVKFLFTWGLFEYGGILYMSGAARVRKCVIATGVVTTVAGSIREGFLDGVGFNAQFNPNPKSLCVRDGVIYVADSMNGSVRKVEIVEPNVVTTFAGGETAGNTDGTGTNARFQLVNGDMTSDASGNIYVAERGGNRIRRISPSGVVTLIAGSETGASGNSNAIGSLARFNGCAGVALDTLGSNLYVSDLGNHCIRRIDLTTNAVSHYSGATNGANGFVNGTPTDSRYSLPHGIAIDPFRNRLYIADYLNHAIRFIELSTNEVGTFAGGSAGWVDGLGTGGQIYLPTSVAVDSSGNVYICDAGNQVIRKLTPSGKLTTLTSLAPNLGTYNNSTDTTVIKPSSINPHFIKVDALSNVYFTENQPSRVRKITPGGYVTTIAGGALGGAFTNPSIGTSARFFQLGGIAVDPTGNLYVCDMSNYSIRKITMNSLTYSPSAPPIAGMLTSVPYSPYPELITIPSSIPSGCNIANFTILKDSLPSVTSLDGTWSLTLDAIGNATTPTNLLFRLFDGYTLVGTGNTISLNQSTLSSYTSSIFLSERTYTSNLTLSLYTASTTSSAAILYMNSSNVSYLKTTIPNQSSNMTALRDSPFVGINCNSPQTTLDVYGTAQIYCDGNVPTSNRPSTSGTRGFGIGVDNLILRTTGAEGSNLYSTSILFSSGNPRYPFGRISGIDTYHIVDVNTSNASGDIVFESQYSNLLYERMRIKGTGYVGIGTSTPNYPLQVESSNLYTGNGVFFSSSSGSNLSNFTGSTNINLTIFARNEIVASAFRAYSDERIKENIQDVQDDTALQRLRLIQPKTYTYKDVFTKGTEPVYGFIAQQVRDVLPYATNTLKNYIPDIYKLGDRVDDLVTLRDSTFSFNESSGNVRFIQKSGSDAIVPVNFISSNQLQILDTSKIDSNESEIFVYGREIEDFHTIDKNAIFTVNVAATQELDRQLQAAKVQIASLETRLALLESQFAASQTQQ